MIQFYAPDIEKTLMLPPSDSQHCVKVLRHQLGDIIDVIDGCGYNYKCRIVDAHPKHTSVEIVEKYFQPLSWNYTITIAVAPTKMMDRMEWLVEKLTEIGVNRIVPILCEHSERKEIKIERLEKTSVSAMKQSLKSTLPCIEVMTPLNEFLKTVASDDEKYVGYCDSNTSRILLSKAIKPNKNITILIGPEGDFSPEEIKTIVGSGFIPMTLGDNRLRTETAALVACETVHIINQISK
ncbi:MAG: 16S rRNA (uracil(1498)-N(3))-methyltransferase [Muribaculaceae bacterium]|nr:16S rRNA (uracil(1498)-N(3))-methyltransferase [Muribaculaceae bacterium]